MFPKGMEWIVILIVALLIFGPKNLPKLGKSLGSTVKNKMCIRDRSLASRSRASSTFRSKSLCSAAPHEQRGISMELNEIRRFGGRAANQMRPVTIKREVMKNALGSCLVEFGDTRVLCAATIEDGLPPWRRASKLGWVTAEYAMLPAATSKRTKRETNARKGRSMEIERLIGRSLRTVCNIDVYKRQGVCDRLVNSWPHLLEYHNDMQQGYKYREVTVAMRGEIPDEQARALLLSLIHI